MTTDDIYDTLAEAIHDLIPEAWAVARLNIQYLVSGHETEFDGVYLTPAGEARPLSSDFPVEVIDAVQELYAQRQNSGFPRWNRLRIDLSRQGDFTTDFTFDPEIQDEDDHFSRGGTVKEWAKIRAEKYGEGTSWPG